MSQFSRSQPTIRATMARVCPSDASSWTPSVLVTQRTYFEVHPRTDGTSVCPTCVPSNSACRYAYAAIVRKSCGSCTQELASMVTADHCWLTGR